MRRRGLEWIKLQVEAGFGVVTAAAAVRLHPRAHLLSPGKCRRGCAMKIIGRKFGRLDGGFRADFGKQDSGGAGVAVMGAGTGIAAKRTSHSRIFRSNAQSCVAFLRGRCPTCYLRASRMMPCNKTCITLKMLCHLFLVCAALTIQLPAQQATVVPQADTAPGEDVTIKARQQEKSGQKYALRGDVEIEFRDYTLRADEVNYDADSGVATATGHVTLDGGSHDEHIEASHGDYNVHAQTGHFFDVTGATGVRFKGKNVSLTTDDPFIFTGAEVEKTGRDHYIVTRGTVTSCRLPDPKWTFNASRITVDVRGSARIYNSTFRIKGVPIFYFPFTAHPVTSVGRQSGFLVPTFGASSRKGTIIGDSFYWAINRSLDATLGAEYYSSRGWAQHGQFRARPSQHSSIEASYFGVLDRGFGPTRIDQGGQDIRLNAEALFPGGVRGVVSANYLSSFIFRLAFTETFSQAVNSEVKSLGFLSKSHDGYFFNALAARYQNFQSATRGDLITIAHFPSLQMSSVDHSIAGGPVYWSIDAAAEGVTRREPDFKTNDFVGRIDLNPRLSLPWFFHGWTFRPEAGFRNTYYTQRRSDVPGVGTPLDQDLNRRSVELAAELRPPTVGRIFERPFFGRSVKHTIEPKVRYRVINGVTSFRSVIRFDERDILSDTSEIEYGITQRLFFKRRDKECAAAAPPGISASSPNGAACDNGPHEFITWEVVNRYYFDPYFGGSIITGQRNVLTVTEDLTGIAFLTEPRRFSPIVSRLRMRASANADISWQLDYDSRKGRINASTAFVNYRLGDFFLGGSHAFLQSPGEIFVSNPLPAPTRFDQFRMLAGYGNPNRRGLSGAFSMGFDSNREFLQYGSVQSSYNWDCCGVSVEYRRFALGSVRNENQFRASFSLANIGSFGNMKRPEKLF